MKGECQGTQKPTVRAVQRNLPKQGRAAGPLHGSYTKLHEISAQHRELASKMHVQRPYQVYLKINDGQTKEAWQGRHLLGITFSAVR